MKNHRALIAFSFYLGVVAAASSEELGAVGAGSVRCSFFNTQNVQAARSDFFVWIQGYVSGLNAGLTLGGKPRFNLTAMKQDNKIWTHLVSYCRRNPSEYLVLGVNEFVAANLPTAK